MMPHPERAFEKAHGNSDGMTFFKGLVEAFATT
jgi:phosphoribosylformylglycinamidine (FGAM) synthase-like amidotransferase family enzyme